MEDLPTKQPPPPPTLAGTLELFNVLPESRTSHVVPVHAALVEQNTPNSPVEAYAPDSLAGRLLLELQRYRISKIQVMPIQKKWWKGNHGTIR